jgi:hypothetical protein
MGVNSVAHWLETGRRPSEGSTSGLPVQGPVARQPQVFRLLPDALAHGLGPRRLVRK